MALYLVKGKPRKDLMNSLRKELDSGQISKLEPFGEELHHGLDNARIENDYVYWVEEDYCSPPLAMERRSVLDRYFNDITVEPVESDSQGWGRIEDKSKLWHDQPAIS